ncbi:MAG: DinB family protein [Arachidicoccus sp.]|nr:DinB family protein [Arachidicoccus sp.]
MQYSIKYIRKNRELFLKLLDGLTIEQLNKIPTGFNNNIIWNFGHIIVSTQLLAYVRSGVQVDFEVSFQEKFKSGTRPESFITQEEIEELKELLYSTLDLIEENEKKNYFDKVIPFSTQTYGFEMNTFEEVLACIQSHESLHYGYALAQKRLVNNL